MKKIPTYSYKKLNYLYHVHDTFTAGMMLEGWEVKSLNEYKCSIETSYCAFTGANFCLINAIITPLAHHILHDTVTNSESRSRKLLLNKHELRKIQEYLQLTGYTCIPGLLYKNEQRLWKLKIHICTGKKNYDKREDIKIRDLQRESQRIDN